MAGESIVYTSAESFQAYVREYSDRLFTKLFYGFKTAQLATPYEGVKGEMILSELQVQDNIIKRWAKAFNPVAAAEFVPTTLKTTLNKVDLSIVPQEYEASYLGMMRQKGQNPRDWPFEAYIMEQIMNKMNQEMEYAFWQGDEAVSPAATDNLRETFDGILTIIADAITATTVTPVATGAITSSNALASFFSMWQQVGEAYKEGGIDFFCSYAVFDNFRNDYKTTYGANPIETEVINNAGYSVMGLRYEYGGGNSYIIPTPGLSGSGRVIATPRENLVYGIDDPSDLTFNFDTANRELQFWADFRMGVQLLQARDGILVVNDQA